MLLTWDKWQGAKAFFWLGSSALQEPGCHHRAWWSPFSSTMHRV